MSETKKKVAKSFAKSGTKTVALGAHKVSDGGHDQYKDGRAGWSADVGSRFHPARADVMMETEYVGPQSTSYNRSTRVGEKVAFEPMSYIVAASAGAGLGSSLKSSLLPSLGRRARYAPMATALLSTGIVAVSHMANARKHRRRSNMLKKWMRTGVPSYRSRL